MNVVVGGSEETYELRRIGTRIRMLSLAFARNIEIDKVIVLNMPIFIINRLFSNAKKYEDEYKAIYSKYGIKIFCIDSKNYHVTFTSILPSRIYLFRRIIAFFYRAQIAIVMKYFKLSDVILWNSSIKYVKSFSCIKNVLVRIYNPIDNMLEHDQISDHEKKMIKKNYMIAESESDLVCLASKYQKDLFQKKETFYISQGVSELFFNVQEKPHDIQEIEGTIIGYIGVMQDRFDTDMIYSAAKKYSHLSFVLIGPVMNPTHFKFLKTLSNVYFLGAKRYDELPGYLNAFDILMIPHKVNDFTNSMNPCKLYEYMSCGKPIISTPVNGTKEFSNILSIVNSKEDFIEKIPYLLENYHIKNTDMVEIAKKNTWDVRVEEIIKYVYGYFKDNNQV